MLDNKPSQLVPFGFLANQCYQKVQSHEIWPLFSITSLFYRFLFISQYKFIINIIMLSFIPCNCERKIMDQLILLAKTLFEYLLQSSIIIKIYNPQKQKHKSYIHIKYLLTICFVFRTTLFHLFKNPILILLNTKQRYMHLFQFSLYVSLTIYVIQYQPIIAIYFGCVVALYAIFSILYPSAQSLSVRRKMGVATWPAPSQGLIYNNISLRVDKLLAMLEKIPKQNRPSITHYVIKACGEVLKAEPQLNGKIIFGKFIPYKTCDVCCLVNIDNGSDVGMMLVKDIPSKSVSDIANEIKIVGEKMRNKGGDRTHKKRMLINRIFPAFFVTFLYQAGVFITSHLGISLPCFGLYKDSMGAMIVTSVGAFGYIDSYGTFFRSTGQGVCLTVNAVHEDVIAVNGKVQVGQMVNVNCIIDHRYLSSARKGMNLVNIFKEVFQNPQKYLTNKSSHKSSKKTK